MSLRQQALAVAAERTTEAQRNAVLYKQTQDELLRQQVGNFFQLPATIVGERVLVAYDQPLRDYTGYHERVEQRTETVLLVDDLEVVRAFFTHMGSNSTEHHPVLTCTRCSNVYPGPYIWPPQGKWYSGPNFQAQAAADGVTLDSNFHAVLPPEERAALLVEHIAKSLREAPKLCPACALNDKGSVCTTCRRPW